MTGQLSHALLSFFLASGACAQIWGAIPPEQAAANAKALATLQSVKGSVEAQVAALDGNVTAGIVLAGDGRLVTLLKESGRLAKALEDGLTWAKEIAASGPPSRVPFDNICKSLTGKDCRGNGSGEGLLTSLKAEEGRLRDALLRVKAQRSGDTYGGSDPCEGAKEGSSPTRLASRASTRLAVIASAINTALAPGGELGGALDSAAAQGAQAGKKGKDITAFARRAKAGSIKRQKALMKALTGKEKATKNDLSTLAAAKARAQGVMAEFVAMGPKLKGIPSSALGENLWPRLSGLTLEVEVAAQGVGEVVADIEPMLGLKKTFLVGGAASGADPKSTTGVFPALKKAEETVRLACGVQDALSELVGSVAPPASPTKSPAPAP